MADRALDSTVRQAQQILTDLIEVSELTGQPDITRQLLIVVMALDHQRLALGPKVVALPVPESTDWDYVAVSR